MTANTPLAKSRCPECDARIFFERPPDVGQMLSCPECGTGLEVIRLSPIELDWAGDDGGYSKVGNAPAEEPFFNLPSKDDDDEEYGADDDDRSGW